MALTERNILEIQAAIKKYEAFVDTIEATVHMHQKYEQDVDRTG